MKFFPFIICMVLHLVIRRVMHNDNLILGGDLNAKQDHQLDKKYPTERPTNKYQGYKDFLGSLHIKNASDPKSQEARLDAFLVPHLTSKFRTSISSKLYAII